MSDENTRLNCLEIAARLPYMDTAKKLTDAAAELERYINTGVTPGAEEGKTFLSESGKSE